MARKSSEPPKLSEMEWEVMKPLWERGAMAARDIYEAIPKEFGWAYETVKTMLSRLVKKGALSYDQIGNSYLYRPVYTRGEITREATGSFVRRVFDGALSLFVAQFVEQASDAELAALKEEVARIERAKSKKRGSKP